MGVIGYELISETTPFHEDNIHETYNSIVNHCESIHNQLDFPEGVEVSSEYANLLNKLVTNRNRRLKYEKIIAHPFFRDINWNGLRHQMPPIIPSIASEDDTSNFADIDKSMRRSNLLNKSTFIINKPNDFSGQNLQFLSYTFVHEDFNYQYTVEKDIMHTRLSQKIKEQHNQIMNQNVETNRLQKNLFECEKKAQQINSYKKILSDSMKELDNMKEQLKQKTAELASTKTEVKTLKSSLKIEEEMRLKNDTTVAGVLSSTYQKWEKAKKLSDQNYEKQISEKRMDISNLSDKLRIRDNELATKVEECKHLQSTLDNYKELLKMAKEQNVLDKNDYNDNKKQVVSECDTKLDDLKHKCQKEKEKRMQQTDELNLIKRQLDEMRSKSLSLEDIKKSYEKKMDELKFKINQQVQDNKKLRDTKLASDQLMEQSQRKCDEYRREISKLQELTISTATSSQRSSILGGSDGEFKSARGSFQEIDAELEKQLRDDLLRAQEGEDSQRKRAENLETVVNRLEDMIAKFNEYSTINPHSAEGLLEKQNEKLEDKLNVIREQAILDKQSARTANLSMWKLEKELETANFDKKTLTRRVEQSEEKFNRMKMEKEEISFKVKQLQDTIVNKEKQVDDLKDDIMNLKKELKNERSYCNSFEKDRLNDKTELVECVAKIQSLEEKLDDYKIKLNASLLKNDSLAAENKRLLRDLNEEHNELNHLNDVTSETKTELENIRRNFNLLKEACNITESQLNELETMLESEVKRNKVNVDKIEELWGKIREKEDKMNELNKELKTEKSQKFTAESRVQQLESELEDIKSEMKTMNQQMVDQQNQLITKTNSLFEVQEKYDCIELDATNIQRVNHNYEKELNNLKEENSKILTELYLTREEAANLSGDLKACKNKINELNQEIEHSNHVASEQKTYYKERDIKNEATIIQYKKLISYLQNKVEELSHKKKKTFAEKVFGTTATSNKKENIAPNVRLADDDTQMKKLQDDLKRERGRNSQIKEQLLKAKTEIQMLKVSTVPKKPHTIEADVNVYEDTPTESNRLQRSETVGRSSELEKEIIISQPLVGEGDKPHSFDMTMETKSSQNPNPTCRVCAKVILMGQIYWRCRGCDITVHRKCRSFVISRNCGSGLDHNIPTTENNLEQTPEIYKGDLVLQYAGCDKWRKINAVYEISENILILGCDTGLFSYNQESGEIVHIKGIIGVLAFAINSNLSKSVLIGDNGEYLYQCDYRHLENRAQASSCLEPTLEVIQLDLSFANRIVNETWHLARIYGESENLHNAVVIAATFSRIVILRYDGNSDRYKAVRALDTAKSVSSIFFTRHTAIVSSDKFFEIDLQSYAAEEFLDMSDISVRKTKDCTPMSAFRVNQQEFILCFKEYGIFVDEYGCRSRPNNINWLNEPLNFVYRDPLLFITYQDKIQIIRISKSFTKELQLNQIDDDNSSTTTNENATSNEKTVVIEMSQPLFSAETNKFGVYVITQSDNSVYIVDGIKALKSYISSSIESLSSSVSSMPLTLASSSETLSTVGN